MIHLSSFVVPVITQVGKEYAQLQPLEKEELPDNWGFAWAELKKKTSPECQGIVQIGINGQCLGLIRFGLYPYPGIFKYLEIEQLEVHPYSQGKLIDRLAKPVGMWLIWYVVTISLNCCITDDDEPLIFLVSFEKSFEYYRDKIGMECLGPVTIAPGEEGFAFRLLPKEARKFCQRVEEEYGSPREQSA
jgi:hypothetical protein